jgi:hypothetical protein
VERSAHSPPQNGRVSLQHIVTWDKVVGQRSGGMQAQGIPAQPGLRAWKAEADCVNNPRHAGNLGSYRFRQVTLLVRVDLPRQIYDTTVVGAHDAFVPFKQVTALTEAIPGVRLTVAIPRAGHTVSP